VVFIVQCFFIRRIWVLSEYKNTVPGILSAIAFITLGAGMFFGIKDFGHQSFSGFHGMRQVAPFLRTNIYVAADYTPIVIARSVSDMILDGAIACILFYYLQKVRHPRRPDSDFG
jgi:hypothetical protein